MLRWSDVGQIADLQPAALNLVHQGNMSLEKLRVLLDDPVVLARLQNSKLRVLSSENGAASHATLAEQGVLSEPSAGKHVVLVSISVLDNQGARLVLRLEARLLRDCPLRDRAHLVLLRGHCEQPAHDHEDDLLLQLPRLYDEVPGVALHPRVRLGDVSDEGRGRAKKERKVQHSAAQQLECELPLHARRQLGEQRRCKSQAFLLLELLAQVVLDSTPQVGRYMAASHELRGFHDLLDHRIVEEALRHVREQRDDGTIEEGRKDHRDDCEEATTDPFGTDVAVPHGGHRHHDEVGVLNVDVPPLAQTECVDHLLRQAVSTDRHTPSTSEDVQRQERQQQHLHRKQERPSQLLL
mmetsp:Transcript_9913/g.28773  ORF Transcript_9913/g.28773 Transcript_9913/m.28773 type:complete len:353 (+) Transcript_9913:322-1380(+)